MAKYCSWVSEEGIHAYITNTTTTTYISPTCYIWSTTRLTSKERCAHSAMVGYYMHPSIPSVSLSNMICLHPLHLYLMWTHTCIISYILRIIELFLKRSDRGWNASSSFSCRARPSRVRTDELNTGSKVLPPLLGLVGFWCEVLFLLFPLGNM